MGCQLNIDYVEYKRRLVAPRCSAKSTFGEAGCVTAEKMKSCTWLKPKAAVRIHFAEWTGADKLRHTKCMGLREDKDPRKVVRET